MGKMKYLVWISTAVCLLSWVSAKWVWLPDQGPVQDAGGWGRGTDDRFSVVDNMSRGKCAKHGESCVTASDCCFCHSLCKWETGKCDLLPRNRGPHNNWHKCGE